VTYAEVVAELVKVNAAIDAITGTSSTSPGAQAYGISGRNITRAPYDALIKRKDYLEGMKSRLDPTSGGAVTAPLFETRTPADSLDTEG
jgi:ribosome modulation factor